MCWMDELLPPQKKKRKGACLPAFLCLLQLVGLAHPTSHSLAGVFWTPRTYVPTRTKKKLKQAATAVLQAKRLTLSPPFRLALTECFALLLQRSTTLGIFTLAKDMQVRCGAVQAWFPSVYLRLDGWTRAVPPTTLINRSTDHHRAHVDVDQ